MKRKNYSKELKTKVALAVIKGNQTANEIASEFGIHVSLVNRWRKEAIEAIPSAFGNWIKFDRIIHPALTFTLNKKLS